MHFVRCASSPYQCLVLPIFFIFREKYFFPLVKKLILNQLFVTLLIRTASGYNKMFHCLYFYYNMNEYLSLITICVVVFFLMFFGPIHYWVNRIREATCKRTRNQMENSKWKMIECPKNAYCVSGLLAKCYFIYQYILFAFIVIDYTRNILLGKYIESTILILRLNKRVCMGKYQKSYEKNINVSFFSKDVSHA